MPVTPPPKMQQAEDYRAESQALARILAPLDASDFDQVTQFKGWTINDVLGHLYMFDVAALKTLEHADAFAAFFGPILARLNNGMTLREAQIPWLDGLSAHALLHRWMENAAELADAYATVDPRHRVKWAGPDMSARSSITARQMETWAHGQEVFDLLGQRRVEQDRIRNIAHLGVGTFGWTFGNRGLATPDPAPYVELSAPSGACWTWNQKQNDNFVKGPAVDFARVVTQVRNVADTALQTSGDTAKNWMRIAQCFAGGPEQPPARGQRHKTTT